MLNLVLIGLNHRTADLDTRQRASFSETELPKILQQLSCYPGVSEILVISTCNRVELLSYVDPKSEGIDSLQTFLSEYSQIPLQRLLPKLYQYIGDQVVRHLFRVAGSLDSMILGEPQILGQVKSSYSLAVASGTIGTFLDSLLQASFRTAKRVRTETNIGEYSVSVSSAAVELARKIFGNLNNKNILIVGAGKMGEMAIRHLVSSGATTIQVANRSLGAALELAGQFHGIAVPFEELRQSITRADIVITSTGASETLIDFAMVQQMMPQRKNAPIVFVDISVPRNVDPSVANIDNVFCYDIDDLGSVVEANLQERRKAAAAAEKIVDQEVESFCLKIGSFDVTPVVIQLRSRIEEICRMELQRYLNKVGPKESKEKQELESMVSRIAGKITHPLMMHLRSLHHDPLHRSAYLDMIKRMFKLHKDMG